MGELKITHKTSPDLSFPQLDTWPIRRSVSHCCVHFKCFNSEVRRCSAPAREHPGSTLILHGNTADSRVTQRNGSDKAAVSAAHGSCETMLSCSHRKSLQQSRFMVVDPAAQPQKAIKLMHIMGL